MNIIYATTFRNSDKEVIGVSADSGFKSLTEVITTMGEDYIKKTKKMVIYGPDEDQVVFSNFPFKV